MPNNFNFLQENGTIRVENFDIEGAGKNLDGVMIKEILMMESLLSQTPQTAIKLQSELYNPDSKNFDLFKNKDVKFDLVASDDLTMKLSVKQKVYRLSDRHFMPVNVGQTEEFTVHACDETLLNDAKCLVSKSWKCTRPSEVVKYVLGHCVEAQQKNVQDAEPGRDYIAENIHPYQVIQQQANVALDGDDPSFVHFMTYEDQGKHYFKSLKEMTNGSIAMKYKQRDYEQGTGYFAKDSAINFSFPCDFDYLSDLLNGLDENGKDQNSMSIFDPVLKIMRTMGGSGDCDCGIGQYNYKMAQSNKASAEQTGSCNLDVESHLLKRQARMALLEKDKIALRITVPCNLNLHVGQLITLEWKNKYTGSDVYGSGDFLITSLVHNIKLGGFSVTNMDCVSKTVGQGVV
jgi:hypothetical protein